MKRLFAFAALIVGLSIASSALTSGRATASARADGPKCVKEHCAISCDKAGSCKPCPGPCSLCSHCRGTRVEAL